MVHIAAHCTALVAILLFSCSSSIIQPSPKDSAFQFYCKDCCFKVDKGTKHCSRCKVCIEGFDHHCDWFNVCVGKRNYRLFLSTVVIITITMLFNLIFCLATVVPVLQKTSLPEDTPFKHISYSAQIGILGVSVVLDGIVLFILGQLIALHIMLASKGITTYELIMRSRVRPVLGNSGPTTIRLPTSQDQVQGVNQGLERRSSTNNSENRRELANQNFGSQIALLTNPQNAYSQRARGQQNDPKEKYRIKSGNDSMRNDSSGRDKASQKNRIILDKINLNHPFTTQTTPVEGGEEVSAAPKTFV